MKQMLDAVKDWVKVLIKRNRDEIHKDMEAFGEELDPGTLLRKTGDASKVRVKRTKPAFLGIPSFTENYADLDAILGTAAEALMKINYGIYCGKAVESWTTVSHIADDSAFEDIVDGGSQVIDRNKALLIYGKGGAWTAAKGKGTADFFRCYLVFWQDLPDSADYPCGWVPVQLGSSGQTARWSLTSTKQSASTNHLLVLKIPKSMWAEIGIAYFNL